VVHTLPAWHIVAGLLLKNTICRWCAAEDSENEEVGHKFLKGLFGHGHLDSSPNLFRIEIQCNFT